MKLTYLIIGAVASTMYLASCEKDEIQSSTFIQSENSIATDSTAVKNEVKVTFEQLPKVIKDQLVAKFKGFELVEAEKVTDAKDIIFYKIKIKVDGKTSELKFDIEGKQIVEIKNAPTYVVLKETDLSDAMKKALAAKYPDYKFLGGNKLQTAANTIYNIKISTAIGEAYVIFDGNGKLLQATEVPKITELKETELPEAIKAVLKEKYSSAKVVSVKKVVRISATTYEVKIKDTKGTVELLFDAAGKLLNSSQNGSLEMPILAANLLPEITTFLKTKYPTFAVTSAKKIVKNNVVSYEVTIKDPSATVELKFDAKGVMTAISKTDIKVVPVLIKEADLSAAIKTYLTTKYAGYTFVSAMASPNEKKEMITNVVIKRNTFMYEIKFNAKGEFVSVSSNEKTVSVSIKLADLPVESQTYIKTNFVGGEVTSVSKVTKGDQVTFMAVVKLKDKKTELTFDAKGKFLGKKD
jgi:Putative beta-lactamase-inhibitor-like, PepSY-like